MFFIGMDHVGNGDGEDINWKAANGKLIESSLHGRPATKGTVDMGLDWLRADLDAREEAQACREWQRKPGIFRRVGAFVAEAFCAAIHWRHCEPTDSR